MHCGLYSQSEYQVLPTAIYAALLPFAGWQHFFRSHANVNCVFVASFLSSLHVGFTMNQKGDDILNPQEFQSAQDFYSFLTIVIAVCAILSPILTALINNHHQKVMKKLEYKHLEHEEQLQHEREICEAYIRAAGSCIHHADVEAVKKYGEHFGLIVYYAPEDIRKDILSLEDSLFSGTGANKSQLLTTIAVKLRKYQQSR